MIMELLYQSRRGKEFWLIEAQKTTGSKMSGKLQILNRTEMSEFNM